MSIKNETAAQLALRSMAELAFVVGLVFGMGWAGVKLAEAVHDRPVRAERDGVLRLGIVSSSRQGEVTFEEGPGYVGWWHCSGQWALSWRLQPASPGQYRVEALASCADRDAGGQIELLAGDQTIGATMPSTGEASRWKPVAIGRVSLGAGPCEVILKSAGAHPATLNIKSLKFQPM